MKFSEVIGQEAIKQRLIQTVKEQRISHAQLFLGSEGTGKLALALAYAQYISCTGPKDSDSCGLCPSCRKYQKLIHPDLHFVFPVIRTTTFTKPVSDNFITEWRKQVLQNPYFTLNQWLELLDSENKQGGIFTHESQVIIRKLSMKAYEATYKIMIIWMPEKMNETAGNKLLKIIEEPPPFTIFLLIAEESELMLKTVLSRTQLVKIPKIDNQSIAQTIRERQLCPENEIAGIVSVANGSFIKALEAIEQTKNNIFSFDKFAELMRLCYARKIIEIVEWVEEIAKIGREPQKRLLNYSLRMIRENYIMNKLADQHQKAVYLTTPEYQFASKFCTFINDTNVEQLYDEFNRAHFHIERNAAAKIVLLDMALKIVKLIRPS